MASRSRDRHSKEKGEGTRQDGQQKEGKTQAGRKGG